MKVLSLFTGYFLILLLIQSFILIQVDSESFESAGMIRVSIKARVIGRVIMISGIALYLFRWSILG